MTNLPLRLLTIICGLTLSTAAFAATSYNSLNYQPTTDNGYYLSIEGSQTLGRNKWTLGLSAAYAEEPVIQVNAANVKLQDVIQRDIGLFLTGAYGITNWLNAGVSVSGIPYMVFQPVNTAASSTQAKMSDLTVNFKFRALDNTKYPVGLAFVPFVTIPTGASNQYVGAGVVTGGAKAVLESKRIMERFSASLNLGYTLREGVNLLAGTRADDTLSYGVGANFAAHPIVDLTAEINGSTLTGDFFGSQYRPLEADAGLKIFPHKNIIVTVGGGVGILKSIGTPKYRALAGIAWVPERPGYSAAYWEERRKDSDGDGVRDHKDRCPSEAGSKKNHGCPATMKVTISPEEFRILTQMIHFDFAKATLKADALPILETLAATLKAKPTIRKISVEGHTDFIGTDAYNQKLSEARAETVRKYLTDHGVDDSRLTTIGFGKTRPVNPARTAAARAENRRVEFVLKDVEGMEIPASVPASANPTLPEGVKK